LHEIHGTSLARIAEHGFRDAAKAAQQAIEIAVLLLGDLILTDPRQCFADTRLQRRQPVLQSLCQPGVGRDRRLIRSAPEQRLNR